MNRHLELCKYLFFWNDIWIHCKVSNQYAIYSAFHRRICVAFILFLYLLVYIFQRRFWVAEFVTSLLKSMKSISVIKRTKCQPFEMKFSLKYEWSILLQKDDFRNIEVKITRFVINKFEFEARDLYTDALHSGKCCCYLFRRMCCTSWLYNV